MNLERKRKFGVAPGTICKICGDSHNNRNQGCNGSGDANSPPKGKGDDNAKGDKDSDVDCDCDAPDPDAPDPPMNGDDPNVCPDWCTTACFYVVIALTVILIVTTFLCAGSESFADCISSSSCSEILNDNLVKALNKTENVRRSRGKGRIPSYLNDQYVSIKKAMRSGRCNLAYSSSENKCGLTNYASKMAGASVFSTGNTTQFHNPMLCRCMDKVSMGQLCRPGTKGSCSDCSCETINVDTIITEDSKLKVGHCWAFTGRGEVQILMFFPIVVLGATLHHPSQDRLPPGYISSAPKDIEIWGLVDEQDQNPHFFGKFEYKKHGPPSQIFNVQTSRESYVKYSLIKFVFLTNHGNPHYTAVYKIEVHGLLDHSTQSEPKQS